MFAGLKDKVSDMVRVKMSKSEYVQLFAEVCTDEKWGPTVPDMDRLVAVYPQGYYDILPEMQLRFDSRKENWRRCYKSLLILDHFCRTLEHRFLDDLKSFMPTLKEMSTSFFHTDDKGVDRGVSIRERAKKIIELLSDPVTLAAEREKMEKASRATGSGVTAGGETSKYQGFGSAGSSSAASAGGGGGGAGRFTGFGSNTAGGAAGSSSSSSTNRGGGDYGGSGSNGRYSGHSSSDVDGRGDISQESKDLELARKMQAEEDQYARAHHQPTASELMRDHEIAKQIAGEMPQVLPHEQQQQQHQRHHQRTIIGSSSSTASRGGSNAPVITSANVISSTSSHPNIDLFSQIHTPANNGPQQQHQQQVAKKPGTDLDDIFGSSNPSTGGGSSGGGGGFGPFGGAPGTGAPTSSSSSAHDPFGPAVGAPSTQHQHHQQQQHQQPDPFGAFAGPGTSNTTHTTSTSNNIFSTTNTSTNAKAGGGGGGAGIDPFASLSTIGGSSSAPKPSHQQPQHHSLAQASATTADIFGTPSPSKPAANDGFPF